MTQRFLLRSALMLHTTKTSTYPINIPDTQYIAFYVHAQEPVINTNDAASKHHLEVTGRLVFVLVRKNI